MQHVLVETNWVVDYAAPPSDQKPAALELFAKAQCGDIELHLPAICLTEARNVIRRQSSGRELTARIRRYLSWARENAEIKSTDHRIGFEVLNRFDTHLQNDLPKLDERLKQLRSHPSIDVFALNTAMLERSVLLSTEGLDLQPFDQSILAAILVRAEELWAGGAREILFCELDSDLQYWAGTPKKGLQQLYAGANIIVKGTFDI